MPEQETGTSDALLLILARDLLISSRIMAVARQLDVPARLIRDPASLPASLEGKLLVVDLDLPGALAAAVEWGRLPSRVVAGFVQHVHTQQIREARQCGLASIIARSGLGMVLPDLIRKHAIKAS